MKKKFTLLLFLILLLSASFAAAETEIFTTNVIVDSESNVLYDGSSMKSPPPKAVFGYSEIYLTVKVISEQTSGTPSIAYYHPHVQTITYKYFVQRDSSGQYTGGYVATGSFPKFQAVTTFPFNLNMTVTKITYPTLTSVVGHNTYYETTIAGGLYQITYNAEIYVNIQGIVTSTVSQTVNGGYYYHYSGTLQ